MKIIHVLKLLKGHSSGFNKQIPSIVKSSPNNYIYNTASSKKNDNDKYINFLKLIKYFIQKDNIIIHFHSLLSSKSVLVAFISLVLKKEIVYSPRGEFRHSAILCKSSLKKILFFKLINPILKRSNIHFLSEVEYSEYVFLNGIPLNYVIIPNAIIIDKNIDQFEYVKPKLNEFKILYVGRILVELKNIRLLISSCKALQKKINNVCEIKLKIQLVGSFGSVNDKEKFYSLIKKHKVESIVEIIGEVPNFKIGNYMRNADLLYNLSFSEGFPNIVLEALYFKLPILCSQNTGIQHYFNNSKVVSFCSLSSTDFINKTFKIITSNSIEFKKEDFDIFRYDFHNIQKEFSKFYKSL
tara:strand:- start:3081 stop:4142 length:1062 start_codon:yes stop_codon:yes gene_type:complete